MQWNHFAAVISLLISIVNGLLALYIYQRRRQPGAKGFLGLMVAIMIYSLGYAFELAGNTIPQARFWLCFEYLGITFIPFFWIAITSDYAGLEGPIKPVVFTFLFLFSATNLVMYLTNDLHHLFFSHLIFKKHGDLMVTAIHRGPWYWIDLTYLVLCFLAGDIIFLQIKERTIPLFRKQINLLIAGSFIPWLGYVFFVLGISPWGLDLTPFSFSLTGLFAALGLFRYRLFDLSPIARDKTFETMRDGVLVVDIQNRVIDFNRAARDMFSELKTSIIGCPVTDVFRPNPVLIDQVLNELELNEFYIGNGTDSKCIQSQLAVALSDKGESLGKIVILSDVTLQKQTEAYKLHAEKMEVLGRLASNITQELDLPLMAMKNNAEGIAHSFDLLWQEIPIFLTGMNRESRQLFMDIIQKLQDIPFLTTREEREGLRKLNSFLTERGLLNANPFHNIMRYIVKLGLVDDLPHFLPVLQEPQNAALLEFVLKIALERKDARTILQAQERTLKMVSAFKNYSEPSETSQPVLTDIQTGVEMVLQMYGNLLKNGVKTITDFKKVPPIQGYPDELQQVWNNLIHNAIQAMEGKGELIIRIYQNEGEVIISFTDNGPGIPQVIQPRIFEPLFTTKKVGEGTGIGLAICKKIVEHHNGKIIVQSIPGQTTFSVCLPYTRQ
jgi:signal transduction histidine kinase